MAERRVHLIGGSFVFFVTSALAYWTWRAWPDVFVDFGRELYLPWRVNQGDMLYRDLAAFNGPLSVYWNALWMRAISGYSGVIASNLVLLAVLLVLMTKLFGRMATPLASYAAVLFFVVVFAFGQTSGVGNYEFLSPYSHEATHGFLLAILLMLVLSKRGISMGRWFLIGVLLGLVFLTKLELFVATAAAVGLGWWLRRDGSATAPNGLLGIAGGFVSSILLGVALLSTAMPPAQAVAALTASLSGALGSVSELSFYKGDLGMGIDRPKHNLAVMGAWSAGFFALVVLALAAERFFPKPDWRLRPLLFAALVWIFSLLPVDWGYVGRPLPALVGILLVLAVWRWRRTGDPSRENELAARATFLCFALFALAKMFLAAKLWHYGFVLASPAVASCMLFGISWLPESCRERGRSGLWAQTVFLALFSFVGWTYGEMSRQAYSQRNVEVAEGADRFLADVRGTYAVEALRAIEAHVGKDETLLVLPEGISLNYLSKRRTPTKYVNFMPPEFALYGEAAMLEALEREPPQAVLLVHKDTSEYGLPLFGRDYGARIFAWFEKQYVEVWSFGDPPLTPEASFGVALFRRSGESAER